MDNIITQRSSTAGSYPIFMMLFQSKVSVAVTWEMTKISSNSMALLTELLDNHHNTFGNLSWPLLTMQCWLTWIMIYKTQVQWFIGKTENLAKLLSYLSNIYHSILASLISYTLESQFLHNLFLFPNRKHSFLCFKDTSFSSSCCTQPEGQTQGTSWE